MGFLVEKRNKECFGIVSHQLCQLGHGLKWKIVDQRVKYESGMISDQIGCGAMLNSPSLYMRLIR